ncbi:hypothetical protein [Bacteroides sp.]|uniref:hypothetical protein n=1 Tax=Bacteroides sp. TaxID=29523 RepID=UPI002589A573|nr:hypothetical protein [Bacteroides sp.]
MRRFHHLRISMAIIAILSSSNFVFAQWDDYSPHKETEAHPGSRVVLIRNDKGGKLEGFQVRDGQQTSQHPLFQINTNGKMVFGTSNGEEHAYLYFMQQDENYGIIHTNGEDFHVDAIRKLWLGARGSTMATFDKNDINFYGATKIHVPFPNPSGIFTFKNGRNGDGVFSLNLSNKWLRIGNPGGIAFWGDSNIDTNDNPQFKIASGGITSYVPLGVVDNNFNINSHNIKVSVGLDNANAHGWIGTQSNNGLYLGANSHASMFFDTNYGIFVGASADQAATVRSELKAKYRLFVMKGVLAEDYGISPINNWSDFVLQEDYNLREIEEVEEFIKSNKHLPDVPSAKQIAEEGYSQHEMNKVLLQKIEELTLYTIKQQKEIEELKNKLIKSDLKNND